MNFVFGEKTQNSVHSTTKWWKEWHWGRGNQEPRICLSSLLIFPHRHKWLQQLWSSCPYLSTYLWIMRGNKSPKPFLLQKHIYSIWVCVCVCVCVYTHFWDTVISFPKIPLIIPNPMTLLQKETRKASNWGFQSPSSWRSSGNKKAVKNSYQIGYQQCCHISLLFHTH